MRGAKVVHVGEEEDSADDDDEEVRDDERGARGCTAFEPRGHGTRGGGLRARERLTRTRADGMAGIASDGLRRW